MSLTCCSLQDNKKKRDKESIRFTNKGAEYYFKWSKFSPETKVFADSSLLFLTEAIKLDSNNRTAYWNKLIFESGLQYFDKAIETAELYYKKFNDPQGLIYLGNIYKQVGDSVKSKEYFNEALHFYVDKVKSGYIKEDSALFELTLTYYLTGDFANSKKYYERYRVTKSGQLTFKEVDFDSLRKVFDHRESNSR